MKSLYTDIVREIKSQIYNGILLEGDKLPSERELSTQYNVSRNVVREAIGALRANGLIKVQAGKGTYVLEPSPTIVTDTLERIMNDFDITIEEILEVREELEVSIIRKAVSSASDSDIEHLKTVYENMETNMSNLNKFIELDLQFHILLAKSTKNPLFYILLNSFMEMTQQVLFEFTRYVPSSIQKAQQHHLEIIKSIENRDKQLAEAIIISHMQVLREEIPFLKN